MKQEMRNLEVAGGLTGQVWKKKANDMVEMVVKVQQENQDLENQQQRLA